MIKVGLTGNRYSGKDKIAKLFEGISIPVFHADIILKFIIQYSLEVDSKIKTQMGASFYSGSNIDSFKFDTTEKFNRLIDIVESDILNAYVKFQLRHSESIYTIFHSSILFEKGWDKKMDINLTAFSPKSDRITRAISVNKELPLTIAHDLISKEMYDLDKNHRSTHVIHNYGNDFDISRQVSIIDQQIIDDFLKKEKTVIKKEKQWTL
jgi:dephospho-CoA kinase